MAAGSPEAHAGGEAGGGAARAFQLLRRSGKSAAKSVSCSEHRVHSRDADEGSSSRWPSGHGLRRGGRGDQNVLHLYWDTGYVPRDICLNPPSSILRILIIPP